METTILIVDDALDSWTLLSSIARTHHFRPIRAADAIQAMSEARKHLPQVILLDIGLPGGSGFVVLERLKNNVQLSAIPVIVVTAQDSAVAKQRALASGATAFLQKPVKADELIATIAGVLKRQEHSIGNEDRVTELVIQENQRLKATGA